MKSAVIAALVWLVTCTAGGLVALSRLQEYGSIVQPLIGIVMGLLGASSHALLWLSSRFRGLGFMRRGLLNWMFAYVPFAAVAMGFVNFELAAADPNFWQDTLRFLGLYTALPMLLVAILASVFVSISVRGASVGPLGKPVAEARAEKQGSVKRTGKR